MSEPSTAASLSGLGHEAAVALAGQGTLTGPVVGVGVDAVDVSRFRRVLGRRVHLGERLFTEGERAYAAAAADPVPRLSTRFAAKEAVMKALGVGLGAFPFRDVDVVRIGLDPPSVVLHGAADALARRAGVGRWHLSLTHTDQVAMALVVAERIAAERIGPEGVGPMADQAGGVGPVSVGPEAERADGVGASTATKP
ncbi:MAG: holo-ACP synthase [Acidimicrobiales bacterium]